MRRPWMPRLNACAERDVTSESLLRERCLTSKHMLCGLLHRNREVVVHRSETCREKRRLLRRRIVDGLLGSAHPVVAAVLYADLGDGASAEGRANLDPRHDSSSLSGGERRQPKLNAGACPYPSFRKGWEHHVGV